MATSNPTYTAADVITDVNSRFVGGTNLSASIFLPWVSYANQKLYRAIISIGQRAKEAIFGDRADITLSVGTLEYALSTNIPRFGGILKVEVQYGATGDVYNPASPLVSITNWKSLDQVSTTYQSKTLPVYYLRRDFIGFIPTPPESGATARVWFVRRPQQINLTTDEIDIPYRFLYPIVNYVHSKAVMRMNEDYTTADRVEANFNRELEEVAEMVADEFEEGVDGIEVSSDSELFTNPLNY